MRLPAARRWRLALGAVICAVLVSCAVTSQRSSGVPKIQAGEWWGKVMLQGAEVFVPASVTDISNAADAIVIGHVVDVTDGRDLVPDSDPTPGDPSIPPMRSVFVYVAVDQLVAGSVPEDERSRLRLEMIAPPEPLTVDDMRASLPSGAALFYLWNSGRVGERNGASEAVVAREADIWLPVSSLGVLVAGTHGLEAASHPGEHATAFLRSFEASSLQAAADKSRAVRRDR